MKTISILNLKGGVGKTVTAVNMAAILATEHHQRVLLVDADSQANATEFYHGDPSRGCLSSLLLCRDPDATFAWLMTQVTEVNGLELICADDRLMDLDLTKVEQQAIDPHGLRKALAALNELDSIDTVIIDCPPAFNAASTAALIASDEVIVPMKLDAFSLRGMSNIMHQIANMRLVNPQLEVAGILPTMTYASGTTSDALTVLRSSGLPVFSRVIRRSSKVDEMTYAQEPISTFSPHSAAGIDYRRFVKEYLERSVNHAV